jgi:acyl-CoA synthetase (AMP-forming)/AMP-acid ligase II
LAESTLLVSGQFGPLVIKRVDAARYESGVLEDAPPEQRAAVTLVGCGACDDSARVEIVNPETCELCPPGAVGEIWVASASVAQGYWGAPEATARTFGAQLSGGDGTRFLRTGDLGFKENGQLFVSGRLKDLVIVRGRKLHPEDVELGIQGCDPALRPGTVAVFGFLREGQERIGIVAGIDIAQAEAAPRIIGELRRRVTENHQVEPSAIVLIRPGHFPRTSSGKVQRHACRDAFLRGELQPLAAWNAEASMAPVHNTLPGAAVAEAGSPGAGSAHAASSPH